MTTTNGIVELVELPQNKLKITPYHPINLKNQWKFPIEISNSQRFHCNAIYNFVLKENHLIDINGITCVTLGHNFKEKLVKHPYFGSEKVINDLKKMIGWNEGFVILENDNCVVRDTETSLVCGLVQSNKIF